MGPTALLPLRRKACWGFFRSKNPTASARCDFANLGTKGQHATFRPPKPLRSSTYCCFFHLRPANQPKITGVAHCHKNIGDSWLRRVVPGLSPWKVALGQAFLRVLRFSPVSVSPQMLSTDLLLRITVTWRTNGQSLETFQNPMLFRKSGSIRQKSTFSSQLMLCREIIAACSEIHKCQRHTMCGQNVEFFNVGPGWAWDNHKGLITRMSELQNIKVLLSLVVV